MYQGDGSPHMTPPLMGSPSKAAPDGAARLVLKRVRKALTAHADGVRLDPVRLIQILSTAPPPAREAERSFALGWLHWLRGDFAAAEPALAEAIRLARRQEGAPPAETAYWLGRVRVLLGRSDAVSEYETVLRETRGEARAVAWLVDLLGRAGRVDRAEQVWKSVRANKKVTACDEGPLLEARALLRRGETAPAERLLNESAPGNGVVQTERRLLLAWALTSLKQYDRAKEQFDRAKEGPYPAAALECWRILLEKRRAGRAASPEEAGRPSALAPLLRGYEALRQGESERAVEALREAAAIPASSAFARYALARLGRDDPAAVLASQPGLFLALRCRALVVLDRFRKRAATPAELLDALRQAASVGWTDPAADHFRRLALAQQLQRPTIEDIRSLTADRPTDPAVRRNLLAAGVELAVRRLPAGAALQMLLEWSELEGLSDALRSLIGRQLLRLSLMRRRTPAPLVAPPPKRQRWKTTGRRTTPYSPRRNACPRATGWRRWFGHGSGRTPRRRLPGRTLPRSRGCGGQRGCWPMAVRLRKAGARRCVGCACRAGSRRPFRHYCSWKRPDTVTPRPCQRCLTRRTPARLPCRAAAVRDGSRGRRRRRAAESSRLAARPRTLGSDLGGGRAGSGRRHARRPGRSVAADRRRGRTAAGDAAGAVVPAPGGPVLARDDAESLAYVRRALQADPDLAADAVRRRPARAGAPRHRPRPGRSGPAR